MGFFDKLRNRRTSSHGRERTASSEHEKGAIDNGHEGSDEIESDTLSLEARNEREIELNPDHVTQNAQMGQQKAEAAALVWPKWAVYATYAWIWVAFFMLALEQGSTTQLNAAAYVDFALAPELTTASILSSIIGG
jgi:hypothetical protein